MPARGVIRLSAGPTMAPKAATMPPMKPAPMPTCQASSGIVRRPVDRADDAEQVDEHHRGRDAVGQGGHILSLPVGDVLGHERVDGDAGQNCDGGPRNDAAKDDLRRHLENELADPRKDQKVDEVVGEQRPEGAEIVPREEFVVIALYLTLSGSSLDMSCPAPSSSDVCTGQCSSVDGLSYFMFCLRQPCHDLCHDKGRDDLGAFVFAACRADRAGSVPQDWHPKKSPGRNGRTSARLVADPIMPT